MKFTHSISKKDTKIPLGSWAVSNYTEVYNFIILLQIIIVTAEKYSFGARNYFA